MHFESICIKLTLWTVLLSSFRFGCYCFCLKHKYPHPTSFPYITLPVGATFPPTSTGTTSTTAFVFSTGTVPATLFTFPTILTVPTAAPTLATFPTLPPSFPTFPNTPLITTLVPCPPNLTLCPVVAGQPASVNGIGVLANGCPCFDPRSSQIGTLLNALQRGDFGYAQRCYTPENLPGFCINLLNCASLLSLVPKGAEFTRVVTFGGYIRRSLCGYDGNDFLVCCPSQYGAFDYFFQTSQTQFTFDTLPPTAPATPPLTTQAFIATTASYVPPANNPPPAPPPPPPPSSNTDNVCGISNFTQTRVVGGNNAKINQYPWIAALGYVAPPSTDIKFFCAGSLISQRHVLTTAHCINDNLRIVRLGAYDLTSTNTPGAIPVDVPILETIVHEQYVANLILNDIALLVLRDFVTVNDQVRPICLPINDPIRSQDLTGYNPFIAGWGTTSYQGSPSAILQEAQIPIISTTDCERDYKAYFPNQVYDERIICAGSGGRDACQGDSGGPLMLPQMLTGGSSTYYYVLIGLVSYGYECAREGFPGVYTRVTAFIPWIQTNMYDDFF